MVTVTTKEELELALNTKEASILIKGELAKTMRKKKKIKNHWGQVHRPWSHRDRYVGSLVYRESVVPVPMILC